MQHLYQEQERTDKCSQILRIDAHIAYKYRFDLNKRTQDELLEIIEDFCKEPNGGFVSDFIEYCNMLREELYSATAQYCQDVTRFAVNKYWRHENNQYVLQWHNSVVATVIYKITGVVLELRYNPNLSGGEYAKLVQEYEERNGEE